MRRSKLHARRVISGAAACLVAACLLSGCIPFATPALLEGNSRGDVTVAAQRDVEVSRTTRVDVLLALGEPDGRAADDSWFSYGSARSWAVGGFAFLLVSGFGIDFEGREVSRLTIEFDAAGVVSQVDFRKSKCSGFMSAQGCLDVRGSEKIAADSANANGQGAALLSYAQVQFGHSPADKCEFPPYSAISSGPLVLTDRAVVMGKTSLNYSDIAELLPIRRKELESWVVFSGRDGICTFIFIPDSKASARKVHDLLVKQVQAGVRSRSEGTP